MPEPAKIRNVAVVGHRGVGKSSLVEALLFQTGTINRLGTVEAGTTVSDCDEDEHKRQLSISMSLEHTDWQGPEGQPHRRPRRPGFQGELRLRCAGRRGGARDGLGGDGRRGEAPRERGGSPMSSASRASSSSTCSTASAPTSSARSRRCNAAFAEVRRRARPDRRRARADRDRRRPAHVRLHEPRGCEGGGARPDSRTSWPTSLPSTARSSSTPSSRPTRR